MGNRRVIGWLVLGALGCGRPVPAPAEAPPPPASGTSGGDSGPDASGGTGESSVAPPVEYQSVLENEWVRVSAERRLYEQPSPPRFLIRVRVENRRDRPLGLDLRDYWNVVFPNQWGYLSEPGRTTVDEGRVPVLALHTRACDRLREAFGRGELVTVAPGASVDYFREFNASDRAAVQAQAGPPFLYVSLAGRLPLTDGDTCRNAALDDAPAGFDPARSDLLLAAPPAWAPLPPGARVVPPDARAPVPLPSRLALRMELPSPADPRRLVVAVETRDGIPHLVGCETPDPETCPRPESLPLDETERREWADRIAAIDGMPRCEPIGLFPNCLPVRLDIDDDRRTTCFPLEWFPRGDEPGPLGGPDPCLAELRLAWWLYATFDRKARAAAPRCHPSCCAPDDRNPDPSGAVECCFCED